MGERVDRAAQRDNVRPGQLFDYRSVGFPNGVNGNIDSDPLFVNSAGGDFGLQSGSPARGAGTSTGAPSTDLDCQQRGSPPSIGAYELNGPNVCGTLQVSPATDVAATGSRGGPFSPALFNYALSTSLGTVNFSISGLPSWLNASVTSGTVTTSPTTVTFTVNTSANSLGAGIYGPSVLTVANTTSGLGTQFLTATLTVVGLSDTHDFNGDGYSDIGWRGPTGDVAIWLMNGTQILSGPDLGNVPTNWTIVGQRQLNNSGYADLLWRGPTGDLSIWFMNGTQILSTADFGTIPTSWSIVGTSAYNTSTGYAELIWRDTAGDLAIWQINGTQILAAPLLGNVPPSWAIAGTGDFSGTGATDLLWRGPTGDMAIWFMNGTQIVSSPDFVNVPTSWTIQRANVD